MAYFDNSATTYPKPNVFYDKLCIDFKEFGVNGSRGKYKKASAMKNVENEFGNILPIAKIFSLAKKFNAITVLDVAQTAGAISIGITNLAKKKQFFFVIKKLNLYKCNIY